MTVHATFLFSLFLQFYRGLSNFFKEKNYFFSAVITGNDFFLWGRKKAKTFLLYVPFCLPFYRPFRRCITSVLLYTFLLLLGPKKLKHNFFTCLTLVFGGGAVSSPVVSPVLLRVLREEHEPPGRRVLQLLLVHKLLHVEAAGKSKGFKRLGKLFVFAAKIIQSF